MMKKTLFNKRICYNDALKLIENGADVNEKEAGTTNTPLFYVSNVKVAQLLIEHGADVNLRDNYGYTALHYINDITDKKMIELFIKAGTVLSILNQHDYVEPSFCRLCIKNGALASDINTYQTFREYFSVDQQKAFDAFASITSYDEDFFQMCLAYQNDQKNNIKIEIKDMDIL